MTTEEFEGETPGMGYREKGIKLVGLDLDRQLTSVNVSRIHTYGSHPSSLHVRQGVWLELVYPKDYGPDDDDVCAHLSADEARVLAEELLRYADQAEEMEDEEA
jgi:hypothetical protein